MTKLDKMDSKVKVKTAPVKEEKSATKMDQPSELQGRDTIYVDTEDDITSIIEKVKKSDSPVVALVPPARVGTLQSVVNLKLLQRAVKTQRKKLVLVTNDKALVGLAAGLKLFVAKNVNAQAEIPASDEENVLDNDIIDGDEISIGELAALPSDSGKRREKSEDKEVSAAVAAIETDDKIKNDHDADGIPDDEPRPKAPKPKKNKRIPDFNSFRKKLLIFGGIGVLLIAFLVWAIVFAPHGTITVKAQTANKNVSATVTLSSDSSSNPSANVLNPIIKQKKNNETLSFDATGTKDIGDKATGKVVIYNSSSNAPITISAGTTLAKGNYQFTLASSVTVPGCQVYSYSHGNITCSTALADAGVSSATAVTATNIGPEYNLAANSQLSISTYNSSAVWAVVNADGITGGSRETAKVVQQSDIDLATEKLKNQIDADKVKSDLTTQMGSGATAIPDSFDVSYGTFNSTPAVGEAPANGKQPSLSVEVTYTLIGIANNDLNALLNAQLETQIDGKTDQKIFDNGLKSVQFKNFQAAGSGFTVAVSTTGKIGPQLDENQIKEMSVGKQSGEIREALTKISGVDDVQVKFSPFWVRSVSATNKLTVNFAVDE